MFTCSTCGRAADAPRIVRLEGAIAEGCVDASHEPHAAVVAPDYAAWVSQARAAGITGRFPDELLEFVPRALRPTSEYVVRAVEDSRRVQERVKRALEAPAARYVSELPAHPRPFYCGECEVTHRDSTCCRA